MTNIFFTGVFGIVCYTCKSKDNAKCADDFNPKEAKEFLAECPPTPENLKNLSLVTAEPFCRKLKSTSEFSLNHHWGF